MKSLKFLVGCWKLGENRLLEGEKLSKE